MSPTAHEKDPQLATDIVLLLVLSEAADSLRVQQIAELMGVCHRIAGSFS